MGCHFLLQGIFLTQRYVRGVCSFLGSVSLQQRFEMGDQCYSSVTVRVLFEKQRIVHPSGVRVGQPQRRGLNPSWLPLCIHFLSSLLSLSYANWSSLEGCSFHPRFSLQSMNLFLFHFCRLFPSLSFSHLHFGLPFPILTA